MGKTILKSIGAVLAGMVVIFILTIITDILVEKAGLMQITPFIAATWVMMLVVVCRCIYNIGAAYLTASLAPCKRLPHAMILGIIGFLFGISGSMIMWDKTPHWFSVALILLPLPCAWLGGMLAFAAQKKRPRVESANG